MGRRAMQSPVPRVRKRRIQPRDYHKGYQKFLPEVLSKGLPESTRSPSPGRWKEELPEQGTKGK